MKKLTEIPITGKLVTVRACWIEDGASRCLVATGTVDGLLPAGREQHLSLDGGKVLIASSRIVCITQEHANVKMLSPSWEIPTDPTDSP